MNDVIEGFYKHPMGERTVLINGTKLELTPSLKVRKHSPDGFNWGYGGSGPSQLALAICLHLFPKKIALRTYQTFKEKYLTKLKQGKDFKIEIMERELNN